MFAVILHSFFLFCRRARVLTANDPTTLEIPSGKYYEDFEAENRLACLESGKARTTIRGGSCLCVVPFLVVMPTLSFATIIRTTVLNVARRMPLSCNMRDY